MEDNITWKPVDFISKELIENLGSMVPVKGTGGYPYELFILIAIGIEFLGACEDMYPWNEEKHSSDRFKRGLDLFDSKYLQYNDFLYKKLRCGMAHIFAPAPGLGIGENRHQTGHLLGKIYNNNEITLSLNIEELYFDFEKACKKVVQNISNKNYPKNSKVYNSFLSVPK